MCSAWEEKKSNDNDNYNIVPKHVPSKRGENTGKKYVGSTFLRYIFLFCNIEIAC